MAGCLALRESRLLVPPTCGVLDEPDLALVVAPGECVQSQRLEHLADRRATRGLCVTPVKQPHKPFRGAVNLDFTFLPSRDSLSALVEEGAQPTLRQIQLVSDEAYFCTGQWSLLLNQMHADRPMQSIDVMDPDRIAVLGIGAFESID